MARSAATSPSLLPGNKTTPRGDHGRIVAEGLGDANRIAHVGRAFDHARRRMTLPLRVQLIDGELHSVVDGLHAGAVRIEGDTDADFSSAITATSAAGEEKLTEYENACLEGVAQVVGRNGHAAVQKAGAASPANSMTHGRTGASDSAWLRPAGGRVNS